jgi:hypothetical protein
MTTDFAIGDTSIKVLRDSGNIDMPFVEGGSNKIRTCNVTAKRADTRLFAFSPYDIVNKVALMDGVYWRVMDIRDGDVAVRIDLEEVDS